MKYEMTGKERRFLRKTAKRIVIQSECHTANIAEYYKIMAEREGLRTEAMTKGFKRYKQEEENRLCELGKRKYETCFLMDTSPNGFCQVYMSGDLRYIYKRCGMCTRFELENNHGSSEEPA